MKLVNLEPPGSIALFVNNIMAIEHNGPGLSTLPFYADGYPGIMFQKTEKGLFVLPQNKQMPDFFLYGQTIHPIELQIAGSYQLIVFQLYPFVIKSFFGVDPLRLNDDCYDLANLPNFKVKLEIEHLKSATGFQDWITRIFDFLLAIFQAKKALLDYKVQQGILEIIASNGLNPIKQIREKIKIPERAFERRFLAQVGLRPKQFSKIIQFQNSLLDLQNNEYQKITDIVYRNGFADQSHFIRVFKAYTGLTPAGFKPNPSKP
jgi:AraC-like DNA-binding protein